MDVRIKQEGRPKLPFQYHESQPALSIMAHDSASMFQPRDRFDQNLLERGPQR